MTPTELLDLLSQRPNLGPSELARMLGISKQAAAQRLARARSPRQPTAFDRAVEFLGAVADASPSDLSVAVGVSEATARKYYEIIRGASPPKARVAKAAAILAERPTISDADLAAEIGVSPRRANTIRAKVGAQPRKEAHDIADRHT